ncbi:MAG: hypothetical protein V3V62_08965, partial [bacterium]
MSKRLAGIIMAALLAAALGIPSVPQAEAPGTLLASLPSRAQSGGASALPAARMGPPAEKPSAVFEAPLTPVSNSMEDCFNDWPPRRPRPQGQGARCSLQLTR